MSARSSVITVKPVISSFVMFSALSGAAYGQAQIVPGADGVKAAEKTDVDGWNPFIGVTSTVSLTSNTSVVGQVDGVSTLFGLGVTGGADYVHGKHLLRSSLSISESFARTPVIDEFLKTNDVVKLEGIYNYFLTNKLGLYGRLAFATSLFPADDVRGEESTWVEKVAGGAPIPLNTMRFRQRLADPFTPFTINESAGVFADPIRKEKLNLSFRLGMGGRHTLADNVLLVDDGKSTADMERQRRAEVQRPGGEALGGAAGQTKDGRANYRLGLSVLMPFVNNDKDNRSAGALSRVGVEGQVQFNVYSWMSLVYNLAITRDPQLFPKGNELVQVQNNLLLTFQFTLVKKKEKAKDPTPEQIELEAAKKRVEEAEQRAKDAEEKLKKEQELPPASPPGDGAPIPVPVVTPPAPPTPTTTP